MRVFLRRLETAELGMRWKRAGAVVCVATAGEPVDRRRIAGVLACLFSLPGAVLAAPRAEEVALRPIAVSAPAAAAFGDQCRSSSAATSGPAVEAGLVIYGLLPVGLERGGPVTSRYASSER